MADNRDLNFQLSDIEDIPTRDHLVEIQEVHDEEKVASLYANGYGIHTETFEVDGVSSVDKASPGEIIFLSGRFRFISGRWMQVAPSVQAAPADRIYFTYTSAIPTTDNSYKITNQESSPVTVKIFMIYKRP